MGVIFLVVVLVLVLAGWVLLLAFAGSAFLLVRRIAASASRRVGASGGRGTARFLGTMWLIGKRSFDVDTVGLDFFDWGIRLAGPGFFWRLMTPVWEARYEDLTEARLVIAPTQRGIRLRAGDGGDEVIFWTDQGSDVLDRLEQHLVPVGRAADQVPDPPPIL